MPTAPAIPRHRRLFANRTLNLRGIRAIGYDMDYTLIHYYVDRWERRAFEYLTEKLALAGLPIEGLVFDPEWVIRGLIFDMQLGNIVKADRFGYVKRAAHGTRMLDFEEQRQVYGRVTVDLREPRWVFLNTLYSLSEGCLYAGLVDALDHGRLGAASVKSYLDLYHLVKKLLDEAHAEGHLKAEIIASPDTYVDLDPELPQTLFDQKNAGKRLVLITNSEWHYSAAMMSFAFDRFMPAGRSWRDLFDLVIVGARKPNFFSSKNPVFEVVSDDGLLRPVVGPLRDGGVYLGGDAATVETHLGLSGAEILYVGDHIFTDVNVTKSVMRWRTALVLRELELEVQAEDAFADKARELSTLMAEKESLEHDLSTQRLGLLRRQQAGASRGERDGLERELARVREAIVQLDERIGPFAREAGELLNARWGLLLRAGNDKSHLARQVERYADIYTSRVSNFLAHTPFEFLRPPRSSLPHDP